MVYLAPYALTKIDVAALRHATYIVAELNQPLNTMRFDAVKETVKTPSNPFATDVYHRIPAPVRAVYTYRNPDAQWRCIASRRLYQDQACEASSILATLRVNDEIAIQFYPDMGATEYLQQLGLRSDGWQLLVYRAGKLRATFTLDTLCSNNVYPMCQNVGLVQAIA